MRGRGFRVARVTESAVYYEANGHLRSGQLATIDDVLEHIRAGHRINGPGDIQKLRPSDRNTAYEWAVLKRLDIV